MMKKREFFAGIAVVSMFVAIPALSWYYESSKQGRYERHARVITLTATVEHGWILGRLMGYNYWNGRFKTLRQAKEIPIKRGEYIILRLESADVVHGFSLKGLGIIDAGEIRPGHPQVVRFVADKTGIFDFNCNRTCSSEHEEMTGAFLISDTHPNLIGTR